MKVGFASKCGSMTRRIRGTNGIPVHKMLVEEREDRHRQRTPLKVTHSWRWTEPLFFAGNNAAKVRNDQGR